jgi:hypothetical protein
VHGAEPSGIGVGNRQPEGCSSSISVPSVEVVGAAGRRPAKGPLETANHLADSPRYTRYPRISLMNPILPYLLHPIDKARLYGSSLSAIQSPNKANPTMRITSAKHGKSTNEGSVVK